MEVMEDGSMYDRTKVYLHTTNKYDIDTWHKKFEILVNMMADRDVDLAENTLCLKSLEWISSFETFEQQDVWVESGIKLLLDSKMDKLYNLKVN